jgi:ethanolamine ammonia-lyase small subunit
VLASFVDTAGGKALVMGRTERAIEQIYAKRAEQTSPLTLTNLCVAHTVLRQWTEARDTCDAAVAIATANRSKLMFRPGVSRTQLDMAASMAYSNRAVLNWLSRDALAAQNDLARARDISPKAFYVTRNERLSVDAPSLAQATDHVDVIG